MKKKNSMATNFEPHECMMFAQSTKIGTLENKAIHSISSRRIVNYNVEKHVF